MVNGCARRPEMTRTTGSWSREIVISVIAAGLIAGGTLTYRHLHTGRDWTLARIFTIKENAGGPGNLQWLTVYRNGILVETHRIDLSRFTDYVWQRHNHLRKYRKADIPERRQREREMIDFVSQAMSEVLIAGGVDPQKAKQFCSDSIEQVMRLSHP
jgi:hypothetical protein